MMRNHRNGCTFNCEQPSLNRLLEQIKDEAIAWVTQELQSVSPVLGLSTSLVLRRNQHF